LRRLGSEAADPIEEFLTRALAYEREHAASLQGFLAWLADGDIEIKRELDRGQGVVRILTVTRRHKDCKRRSSSCRHHAASERETPAALALRTTSASGSRSRSMTAGHSTGARRR
jgi:hypothetical protein